VADPIAGDHMLTLTWRFGGDRLPRYNFDEMLTFAVVETNCMEDSFGEDFDAE